MLTEALASEAGKVLLPYVLEKVAAQNNSTIKNTQAGQAGAVPAPDTAPLTGAPKATDVGKQDDFKFVNDWDAKLYNTHNSTTMAGLANSNMSEKHGTNGTPYRN